MKLQQKLTLQSLLITITVLGISFLTVLTYETRLLRQTDEQNVQEQLSLSMMHMQSFDRTDISKMQSVTLRSVITYTFRVYADLLKNEQVYYSLTEEDQYLYNICPYDPLRTGIDTDTEIPQLWRGTVQDHDLLVTAQSLTINEHSFTIYVTRDVTDTENQIRRLIVLLIAILAGACLLVIVLTNILMSHMLRPIQRLTESASSIASGSYSERTHCCTPDEIGQLSRAFDHMAEVVEEKIESLNEQITQKQLMLGALTHELKTPMTAIIGYSDSLLRMPLNEEQRRHCALQIHETGKRTESLSQKLMTLINLSESSGIEKQWFPTDPWIERLQENVTAPIQFMNNAESLHGDPELLYSLTMNLISNAQRASSCEAPIIVTIASESITVTDHGCGIPKEHLSRITEPFYRVDAARSRKYGGSGLGLALCQMIAEAHGGALHIQSEIGIGTTVTAYLQLDSKSSTNC